MIKTQSKVEMQEVISITDILCNNCGESCFSCDCDDEKHKADMNNYYGVVETVYISGYFSPAFPDGMRYTFSICEKCLKKIVEGFKIPSKEEDCM